MSKYELTPEQYDEKIRAIFEKKRELPTQSHYRKWTENELSIRREAILREFGMGKSYSKLCYELVDRWGITLKVAKECIKDVYEQLKLNYKEELDAYKEKMIEKLERLADDAERHGDRKAMLAAYDQINKIQGVYSQKVEADVKSTMTFDFGE